MGVRDLIRGWLLTRLPGDSSQRVDERIALIEQGAPAAKFFTSFSAVPRDTGKADLELTDEELIKAEELAPGWKPVRWTLDQAARTLIVLALPRENLDAFASTLNTLWDAADMGEQIALYAMLPLLPDPGRFESRAAEGLRTNIAPVFEAVAHYSPFPRKFFGEERWNQMILKALFIESSLEPVHGLDERNNPRLAEMLVDYANERIAAGRSVSEELLRLLEAYPDARKRMRST